MRVAPLSLHTMVCGYSKFPVSSIVAVSAARGAVSHRRMRGPAYRHGPGSFRSGGLLDGKPPSLPVTMAMRLYRLGCRISRSGAPPPS